MEKEKIFVAKKKKSKEGKEKMQDKVYTAHDSSNEPQKEKLEAVPVGIGIGPYRLIYDGTGSEEGITGWYLVVLGQYGTSLVDI